MEHRPCYRQDTAGMDITSDILLIDYITKAIIEAAQGYYFYERLAQLANNEQNRQLILRIQKDEAKHYLWFRPILRRLAGQHPEIPYVELPVDFEEGLKRAINNELEVAYLYQFIANNANANHIVWHFTNAAIGKRRNAYWLSYMLMNL